MRIVYGKTRGEVHRFLRIEDGPVITTEPRGPLPAFSVQITAIKIVFDVDQDSDGSLRWRPEQILHAEGLIIGDDGVRTDRSWRGWIQQTKWSERIAEQIRPTGGPESAFDVMEA